MNINEWLQHQMVLMIRNDGKAYRLRDEPMALRQRASELFEELSLYPEVQEAWGTQLNAWGLTPIRQAWYKIRDAVVEEVLHLWSIT